MRSFEARELLRINLISIGFAVETYIRSDPGPRWKCGSHCSEKINLIERIGEIDSIRRPADRGKMAGERKPWLITDGGLGKIALRMMERGNVRKKRRSAKRKREPTGSDRWCQKDAPLIDVCTCAEMLLQLSLSLPPSPFLSLSPCLPLPLFLPLQQPTLVSHSTCTPGTSRPAESHANKRTIRRQER